MQPARADVFGPLIHGGGNPGNLLYGVTRKIEPDIFGIEQGDILGQQGIFGFGQDAHEVAVGQRFQFHPNREAPLKLRDQVRGFGGMKRARGHKQDMVGADHAVFGVDGAAFDQRQQVALHPLAGDICAVGVFPTGDFIDFVNKDDAGLLDPPNGLLNDRIHIHQLIGLFDGQNFERFRDLHPAFPGLLGHHIGEHLFELILHFFHALRSHDFDKGGGGTGDFKLHLALVQLPVVEHPAHFFPGAVPGAGRSLLAAIGGGRGWRKQQVEQLFFGLGLGLDLNPLLFFLLDQAGGQFHQVPHHGFDIAAHIADLGKLRCLDFDKRSLSQTRQTAGDLGFADPGRTDHQNVFGGNLVAQIFRDLLPSPAIPQRNGHGAFGFCLADNIAVQFGDDFSRGHNRRAGVLNHYRRPVDDIRHLTIPPLQSDRWCRRKSRRRCAWPLRQSGPPPAGCGQ